MNSKEDSHSKKQSHKHKGKRRHIRHPKCDPRTVTFQFMQEVEDYFSLVVFEPDAATFGRIVGLENVASAFETGVEWLNTEFGLSTNFDAIDISAQIPGATVNDQGFLLTAVRFATPYKVLADSANPDLVPYELNIAVILAINLFTTDKATYGGNFRDNYCGSTSPCPIVDLDYIPVDLAVEFPDGLRARTRVEKPVRFSELNATPLIQFGGTMEDHPRSSLFQGSIHRFPTETGLAVYETLNYVIQCQGYHGEVFWD